MKGNKYPLLLAKGNPWDSPLRRLRTLNQLTADLKGSVTDFLEHSLTYNFSLKSIPLN